MVRIQIFIFLEKLLRTYILCKIYTTNRMKKLIAVTVVASLFSCAQKLQKQMMVLL